jgi:hypothetical protein
MLHCCEESLAQVYLGCYPSDWRNWRSAKVAGSGRVSAKVALLLLLERTGSHAGGYESGVRSTELQSDQETRRLEPRVYGPTNVVTLAAGSVATKALPPTVMLGCGTRFKLADVTHGTTVFAVKPLNAKSSVTAEAF